MPLQFLHPASLAYKAQDSGYKMLQLPIHQFSLAPTQNEYSGIDRSPDQKPDALSHIVWSHRSSHEWRLERWQRWRYAHVAIPASGKQIPVPADPVIGPLALSHCRRTVQTYPEHADQSCPD